MAYTLPAVAIAGVGQSRVYHKLTGKRAFPPDVDTKRLIKKIAVPFVLSALFRTDCLLSKSVYNGISEQLEYLSLDENGHEKHELEVEMFHNSFAESDENERKFINRMLPADKITQNIGEDNFYFFTYNSFGDIEKITDSLHEFILNIIKEKGVEKVNLVPVSLGGTVANSYLHKYAHLKKVHRVVGVVPAFDGSSLVSGVLDGTVASHADEIIPKELKKLCSLLTKKTLSNVAENVIKAFCDQIFLRSSVAWGAVPHEAYLSLAEKYNLSGEIKKTCDKYFRVRNDFYSFVKRQEENGITIFSLCGYGLNMENMFRKDRRHSDGIVDTFSSSMGAKADDISKPIDVTSSAIGDRVWFFEKMGHEESGKNEKLLALTSLLLKDDTINSVFDDINFKQFN